LSLVRALSRQFGEDGIVYLAARSAERGRQAVRQLRDEGLSPESDADTIRGFVDTNNHGTHRMIRAFGPILNDNARFIVVASAFGRLRYLREELRPRFDPAALTLDGLEKLLAEYTALVEAGEDQAAGWPSSITRPICPHYPLSAWLTPAFPWRGWCPAYG
jgi:hypothetical protein